MAHCSAPFDIVLHGGFLPNLLMVYVIADPNNAQAGFVSVIVGAGAAWFGLYVNSKSDK